MKQLLFGLTFLLVSKSYSHAQEFPKGWVLYLEGMQGIATTFHSDPDTYTGSLQLSPQITLLPDHLRAGASGGLTYNNKRISGLAGPVITWKLSTVQAGVFGSIMNFQLQLQHLWGSNQQKLLGGGLKAELGQILLIGLTAHRDYQLNIWWFQSSLGYNILHKKRNAQPHDPFSHH